MLNLFRKTRELEARIEEFLDVILHAALEFRQAIRCYLEGEMEEFETRAERVDQLEGKADGLRREIENRIYSELLLPEARGDVLALLENSDDVLNVIADTLVEFSVEKPAFFPEIRGPFLQLADVTMNAVEEMVAAVRAYFRDLAAVPNHIAKVMFYEKESDRIGEKIKRHIFGREDLDLCHKVHLRTFVGYLQHIADQAEDVGDRVSIYVIKRMV